MVNISVLNSELVPIGVLDKYDSFIWTDRYYDTGEFELCIPVTANNANRIKEDYYLSIPGSDRLMIVETIKIITDKDEGNSYNITGRSLEAILDRRIVWKQTNVNGSIQNAIKQLIDDAFINPTDSRRRVSNMTFSMSADPAVTGASYAEAAQYMGNSILDVIKKVCPAYPYHLGFKMTYENGNFVFGLYAGKDRSYRQTENNYVVFSPGMDNLLSSKYLKSIKNYKNVLRIAGEGEGATQTFITHYLEFDDDHASEKVGLARREIYVDCHDVSSVTSSNITMDVQQYTNVLVQKGVENTIRNIGRLGHDGMRETDEEIIKIMLCNQT